MSDDVQKIRISVWTDELASGIGETVEFDREEWRSMGSKARREAVQARMLMMDNWDWDWREVDDWD